MHGLGLKVVSALSEHFYCKTIRNGQYRKLVTLIVYKTNGHKRPPTFINREFAGTLFKTHRFRENLAFSVCSLLGSFYAISTCQALGKIKTQKNPAIKDWIIENKKNGRPILLNLENSLKLKMVAS